MEMVDDAVSIRYALVRRLSSVEVDNRLVEVGKSRKGLKRNNGLGQYSPCMLERISRHWKGSSGLKRLGKRRERLEQLERLGSS